MVWQRIPGADDMVEEKKNKYTALGISLLLHVILFVAVAMSGLFALIADHEKMPVDVEVYDLDELAQSETASPTASTSDAGGAVSADIPSAEMIMEHMQASVPEIAEEYTRRPENQQAYREQQAAAASGSPAVRASDGDGAGEHPGNRGDAPVAGHDSAGPAAPPARDPVKAQQPKTPPVFQSGTDPVYPENLRQQNIEGVVTVHFVVNPDGSVGNLSVASSSGYGEMDAAALQAVSSYRFSPACNAYGEPVACGNHVTIPFQLR